MTRLLLGLALCLCLPAWGEPPDLEFLQLDGKRVTLRELIRRSPSGMVVLTVWCSKCNSCRRTEAEMDKLARDLKGQALVLAVDASVVDKAQNIEQFQSSSKLTFPVLMDQVGGMVDRFNIKHTTSSIIFDKAGEMRYFGRFGYDKEHYAAQAAREILADKPVSHPTTPMDGCPIPRPIH